MDEVEILGKKACNKMAKLLTTGYQPKKVGTETLIVLSDDKIAYLFQPPAN